MPKKKFNLAVCFGTLCNVVSERNSFSILNACGNVTKGNMNQIENFTVNTTNIMYGVNNKIAYRICDAERPMMIANVTMPALLSFSASRVLLLCRMASVLRANGIAKNMVDHSQRPVCAMYANSTDIGPNRTRMSRSPSAIYLSPMPPV